MQDRECYYDSEEFAEGERRVTRATRRVDASSRKLRDLAAKIEELRSNGEPSAGQDAERSVAR